MPLKMAPEKVWYHEGLRFECTSCGQCCTGSPGYVWITPEEIITIAEHLGLDLDTFVAKYVRQVGSRFSLKEEPGTFDCVFLREKKCSIYPCRPKQCRTFPFWPQHLASKEAWNQVATYCEGICSTAPVIPAEEIDQLQ